MCQQGRGWWTTEEVKAGCTRKCASAGSIKAKDVDATMAPGKLLWCWRLVHAAGTSSNGAEGTTADGMRGELPSRGQT